MKNTSFKQNNFETEVTCREEAMNFTTEPLQGSMILYSGHCPHTKCLRHFSMGFTTNRSRRDLTPKCLRHVGVPRLASGRGAVTSGGREAAGRWKPMPEYVNNSSGHDAGGRGKPLQKYVNNSSGHDASRPCDKALKISGVDFGGDASRRCDKVVKISGIDFGCDALRCYDKLMIIRGLMVCGEERGGRMVNMLSRGRFRRDLRRRLQKRGMRHLRSP